MIHQADQLYIKANSRQKYNFSVIHVTLSCFGIILRNWKYQRV